MRQLFYKPIDSWVGDVIPFWWEGKFYLFYLNDTREPEQLGEGVSWNLVSTEDFLHYTEYGTVLARGSREEPDYFTYTGCVVRAEGQFHMFYAGHNPFYREQGKAEECCMHAVSDDLLHWKKCPEDTIWAGETYDPHTWRDPFVFFDPHENCYQMLLAARYQKGDFIRTGCTVRLRSADLSHWEPCGTIWEPGLYFTHEVPDIFYENGWYYLIFSEYSAQHTTRYVKSRNLNGPWIAPENDMLDTGVFYAGKTFTDGTKRYLFGWNATKQYEKDMERYDWGGNLVVHELFVDPHGDLAVKEPEPVKKALCQQIETEFSTMDGCEYQTAEGYHIAKRDGSAAISAKMDLPPVFRMECEINFEKNPKLFGIQIHHNQEQDQSEAFAFSAFQRELSFDQRPVWPWRRQYRGGIKRTWIPKSRKKASICLLVDHSMATMYVDQELACTVRGDLTEGKLSFFVEYGEIYVENVKLFI